jgi:hypothetical protein
MTNPLSLPNSRKLTLLSRWREIQTAQELCWQTQPEPQTVHIYVNHKKQYIAECAAISNTSVTKFPLRDQG